VNWFKDEIVPALAIVTLFSVIFLIGCLAGEATAGRKFKREAVARGHAEFVADKEGNVEFKWKEIK